MSNKKEVSFTVILTSKIIDAETAQYHGMLDLFGMEESSEGKVFADITEELTEELENVIRERVAEEVNCDKEDVEIDFERDMTARKTSFRLEIDGEEYDYQGNCFYLSEDDLYSRGIEFEEPDDEYLTGELEEKFKEIGEQQLELLEDFDDDDKVLVKAAGVDVKPVRVNVWSIREAIEEFDVYDSYDLLRELPDAPRQRLDEVAARMEEDERTSSGYGKAFCNLTVVSQTESLLGLEVDQDGEDVLVVPVRF
ncbi:hypothetical protein ACFSR9_05895 [Deinococcus taklimakanensis]|uniref:Uncharacterized protein n=1 Tax=Deinococcus taklimakanensis TaxID=536443 RepID=A0ABW5P3B7_9DEIO